MIEVEVKIPLEAGQEKSLIKNAQFLKEITMVDIYYDTDYYALTTKDIWLRKRNGSFELKLPLGDKENLSEREFDQYSELTKEDEIRLALRIIKQRSLEEDLTKNGYKPFATITTKRKKYRRGEFIVDIDDIDYGYFLAEVEMMVEKNEDMETAREKILKFVKDNNLVATTQVRGKVVEYIRRFRPEHYKALVEAGTILDIRAGRIIP